MKYHEISIILFIFLSFIPLIKNQTCSGCSFSNNICTASLESDSCDSQICRPNFSSGQCKDCRYNTNNYKFYSINSGGNCDRKQSCDDGQLIVYGTNECIPPDTSTCFIMGDYCYSNRPDNSERGPDNKYICRYYHYITKLTNTDIKEYHCLSSDLNDWPNNYIYFNSDTKEIGKSWSICSNTPYKKKNNI